MSSETEEIPQFRQQDLPMLEIHPGFDSSDSSDPGESSAPSTPSTPRTPCTPSTPVTQLSSDVSSFAFEDIEEGASLFAIPKPKRVYTKKKPRFFTKGHAFYKKNVPSPEPPPKKKIRVTGHVLGFSSKPSSLGNHIPTMSKPSAMG